MTISRNIRTPNPNKIVQRNDRIEISQLMQIWADNKQKWRKNPQAEVDINGVHFVVKSEPGHFCLRISCKKYSWLEDYSPQIVTAIFGNGR